MAPYASVIVPTHDRHATLQYAIASIQAQSVTDIEILIIGDGATPSVSEIARSIASQDARVRFLAFEKCSHDGGANCHQGVRATTSERVFYCDDDDVWLPQHVATLGPELDRHDVADTMPVSVSLMQAGELPQLHGTLVNSGSAYTRSLLVQNKLKLTYDTHIAHRRSPYFQLGAPWIASTGPSVTHMLSTFARSEQISWKTLAAPTALSLHGAARSSETESARRTEIEQLLRHAASLSPNSLFLNLDFSWHFMRTIWTDPPSGQSLENYLARAGIALTDATTDATSNLLAVPLTNAQWHCIGLVYSLYQGYRPHDTRSLTDIVIALLDNVLGGFIPVEYSLKLLRPFGPQGAIEIVKTILPREQDSSHLSELLLGHCLCEASMTDQARKVAARLKDGGRLRNYDLTRLLVRIDLSEGSSDSAVSRLEHAWRESPSMFVAGLELANLFLALGRPQRALATCVELEEMHAGHEWLESLKAAAEKACAAHT